MAETNRSIEMNEAICTICLDPWIDECSRSLECQHIFHSDCLQHLIINESLKCPICRHETSVLHGNVGNLPKNPLEKTLEITKCLKHNEELCNPIKFCLKCNKKINCKQCLIENHQKSNCKIVIYKEIKRIQEECYENIEKQKDLDLENLRLFLKKLLKMRKNFHRKLEYEFIKIFNQVEEYYKKRSDLFTSIQSKDINAYDLRIKLDEFSNIMSKDNQVNFKKDDISINLQTNIMNDHLR